MASDLALPNLYIPKSLTSSYNPMEIDQIIRQLSGPSSIERRSAIEQLQKLLNSDDQADRSLSELIDSESLFVSLSPTLSDPDWQIRLTSVQIMRDIISRNIWPLHIDTNMAIVMPRLMPCLGDVKVTVKRAVTQCLHVYLRLSANFEQAIQAIIRYGLYSSDDTLVRDCCIALPVLLTPDICHHQHVYFLLEALVKKALSSESSSIAKLIRKTLGAMERTMGSELFHTHFQRIPAHLQNNYHELNPSEPPSTAQSTQESLYCGFIPFETKMILETSKDARKKFSAVEDMKIRFDQIIRRSSHIILSNAPQFLSLIEQLLQDMNFHVVKLSLEMMCVFVELLNKQLRPYTRHLVYLLYRSLGDPKLLVQVWVMKFAMMMVRHLDSQAVLTYLLDNINHKNSRVRQEIVNIVIAALLQFPSVDFQLDLLCSLLAPVLVDRKQNVRVSGLECMAVLAHLLGAGNLRPLVQAVDAVELRFDVEGVMESMQGRLALRKLPHLNAEGLVEYVTRPVTPSVNSTASGRTSGRESSLEITDLEGQPNQGEKRKGSANRVVKPKSKLPWESGSDKVGSSTAEPIVNTNSGIDQDKSSTQSKSINKSPPAKAWEDKVIKPVDEDLTNKPFSKAPNGQNFGPRDEASANGSYSYVPARPQDIHKVKDLVRQDSNDSYSKIFSKTTDKNKPNNQEKDINGDNRDKSLVPSNNKVEAASKGQVLAKPSLITNRMRIALSGSNENQPKDSPSELISKIPPNNTASKSVPRESATLPVANNQTGPFKAIQPVNGQSKLEPHDATATSEAPVKPKVVHPKAYTPVSQSADAPFSNKGSYQQVYIDKRKRAIEMEKTSPVPGYRAISTGEDVSASNPSYQNSLIPTKPAMVRNAQRRDSEPNEAAVDMQLPYYGYDELPAADELINEPDVSSDISSSVAGIRRSASRKKAEKEAESRGSLSEFSSGLNTPYSPYGSYSTPTGYNRFGNNDVNKRLTDFVDDNGDDTTREISQTLKDLANQRRQRQQEIEAQRRKEADEARKRELERRLADLERERKLEEERAAKREQQKAKHLGESDSGMESYSGLTTPTNESMKNGGTSGEVKQRGRVANHPSNSDGLSGRIPRSRSSQSTGKSNAFDSGTSTPQPSQPVNNPDRAISDCLSLFAQNDDWQAKVDAINLLNRLLEHHANVLVSKPGDVHQLTLAIITECKNLRSQVSRVAVRTLGLMYQHLRKSTEPDLDRSVNVLLSKAGESSNFVKEDVELALDTMVQNVTPQKAALALINTGAGNKNIAIRKACAQYLSIVCEMMGPAKILSGEKNITEKVLPAVAQFTIDGNSETRYYSRKIFYGLMNQPDFDRICMKNIPESHWRSIKEIIENLRTKGLSEPTSSTPSASLHRANNMSRSSSAGGLANQADASQNKEGSASSAGSSRSNQSTTSPPNSAASKWKPTRQSEALNDEVNQLCSRLSANDWRERYQGVEDLVTWVEKSPTIVSNNIVKIFDKFIPRLSDSNSKVSLFALQSMAKCLEPLKASLKDVINLLVQHTASVLASKNQEIVEAGGFLMSMCVEKIDGVLLVQPFVQAVTAGNQRNKSELIDHLTPLVQRLGPRKPRLIILHVLPELWRLLQTLAPTGDTASGSSLLATSHPIRGPTHRLVAELNKILGDELLEQARANLTMTGSMLSLLNEMIRVPATSRTV